MIKQITPSNAIANSTVPASATESIATSKLSPTVRR